MKYSMLRILVLPLLLAAVSGRAQQNGRGTLDAAVLFDADRSGLTAGHNQFWMQGGSFELGGTLWRGWGVVADVTGTHTGNTGQSVPLSLVTATFGPRYTWSPHRLTSHSIAVFGQGLIGEADGFDSLFPHSGAAIHSANSLAVQAGGGVNLRLNRRLSVRLVEADWLRTQLPNSTTNVQNSVLLDAGMVIHCP